MQDLLFFMEPSEHEWITALNIGNLYLNRFTINEDDAFEIIGVHELTTSRYHVPENESQLLIDDIENDTEEVLKAKHIQKGMEISLFEFYFRKLT